jgi:hypothetical protein
MLDYEDEQRTIQMQFNESNKTQRQPEFPVAPPSTQGPKSIKSNFITLKSGRKYRRERFNEDIGDYGDGRSASSKRISLKSGALSKRGDGSSIITGRSHISQKEVFSRFSKRSGSIMSRQNMDNQI